MIHDHRKKFPELCGIIGKIGKAERRKKRMREGETGEKGENAFSGLDGGASYIASHVTRYAFRDR